MKGVQIENRPAVELMKRFNHEKVLIYLAPPYILRTRHGKQYRHEMDDTDHNVLLDVALAHKGPVIISGCFTMNAYIIGTGKKQPAIHRFYGIFLPVT